MAAFLGLAAFIAILEFNDWDGLRWTLAGASILFGLISGFWPMYAIVVFILMWGFGNKLKNEDAQFWVMLIGMIGLYVTAAGATVWGIWRLFFR